METREELINEICLLTGFSEEQVIKSLDELFCNPWSALRFVVFIGRFPNKEEQELINKEGVDKICKSLTLSPTY
ncbi:hypothetical protein [Adhaeribacter aquaticus]|uniref:hypothetical protein n=1 Tax=Adhaeribacter aquaticus TaxID=299567 RepID=UPI00040002EF|nr:hypothetical protein [Adhaeribacter aquaticus]